MIHEDPNHVIKARKITHCLVTLSEKIGHSVVGTQSGYLSLLDKDVVFDKKIYNFGLLWL